MGGPIIDKALIDYFYHLFIGWRTMVFIMLVRRSPGPEESVIVYEREGWMMSRASGGLGIGGEFPFPLVKPGRGKIFYLNKIPNNDEKRSVIRSLTWVNFIWHMTNNFRCQLLLVIRNFIYLNKNLTHPLGKMNVCFKFVLVA